MTKTVCFTGVEAPGGVSEILENAGREYREYTAIIGGKIEKLRIYKDKDLIGFPGWAMWPGVYDCDFDSDGFVVKTRVCEDVISGYCVSAPQNGRIRIGVYADEYAFAPGAPLYLFGKGTLPLDCVKTVSEARDGWNDNWFARLNQNNEIAEMWVCHEPGLGDGAILHDIRRFKSAWGPTAENGLAIEYNYFEPDIKNGAKLPIFVWFHGLHGGTGTWTNQFEFNPIAKWSKPEFQSLFADGGAYIITPRANEDLRDGHGISWNRAHIEPFFAMIDDFAARHPNADPEKLIIGGFSMGGIMTWLCLAARPERVACALPVCGFMPPAEEDVKRSLGVPVYHIHGDGDGGGRDTPRIRALMEPYTASNALSRLTVLEQGYKFPDGTRTPIDHLVWIPVLNNMKMDDGSPYQDIDGAAASAVSDFFNAAISKRRG